MQSGLSILWHVLTVREGEKFRILTLRAGRPCPSTAYSDSVMRSMGLPFTGLLILG